MKDAKFWIKALGLQPNPEGGHYCRTYTSAVRIAGIDQNGGDKASASAIYYLLESDDVSGFHRLHSDELWFFHYGSPIQLFMITKDGTLNVHKLGINHSKGECLQLTVPAGSWFAAKVESTEFFALISCVVTPEFTFNEFELGKKEELIQKFPQHTQVFNHLCR